MNRQRVMKSTVYGPGMPFQTTNLKGPVWPGLTPYSLYPMSLNQRRTNHVA